MAAIAAGLLAGTADATTLTAGSFVFDGGVEAVALSGGDVFVGGTFTEEQAATGAGLVLSQSGAGAPDMSRFPAVDGEVDAATPDGSGGWYIGGTFQSVGGQARADLAHVLADGTVDATWHPNVDQDDPGVPDAVYGLAVAGTTLYVRGSFSSIDGENRNGIAALDAASGTLMSWNPAPDGEDTVYALAVSGSNIYVGGGFTSIGGQSRDHIAALDAASGNATTWNPNADHDVAALAVSGSTIYAAGAFTTVGGQARNGLAALDVGTGNASAWNPAPDDDVYALAVSGSTVYTGGTFTSIGGQTRHGIAAVNATSGAATTWNPDADDRVTALAVSGATVYAAGPFTSIGGQSRAGIAALDATSGNATTWNPAPNGPVETVAASTSDVYVGGAFTGAGPALATAARLAKLDAAGDLDASWTPAVTGTPADWSYLPDVTALAVSGSTLYVGGAFTSIGGQPRNGLASLDASTGAVSGWNPNPSGSGTAASGSQDPVRVLVPSGSTVYVVGDFSSIGGQSRFGIADINASTGTATSWNPNPNGRTVAIGINGSTVYLGGTFTTIGGQARHWLAAVDAASGSATSWNPAPSGGVALGGVAAIVPSGQVVYVGGDFSSIGGQSRQALASVDATTGNATSWAPTPMDSWYGVSTLALSGSTIYEGGSNGVAAFDVGTGQGTGWAFSGDGDVFALATSGSTVYAGTARGVRVLDSTVRDTTAPSITITAPTEGQHFSQGQSVSSSYSCDDGTGSGVQTCTGPATVDTSSAGAHQFTVTASDVAGNSTSKTVNYVVDAPAATPPPTTTTTTSPPPPAGGGGSPGSTKKPALKHCVVPKLTGETLAEAKKKLTAAHCALGKTSHKHEPKAKRHKVVSQSKHAGTRLARGTKISLVVGS